MHFRHDLRKKETTSIGLKQALGSTGHFMLSELEREKFFSFLHCVPSLGLGGIGESTFGVDQAECTLLNTIA